MSDFRPPAPPPGPGPSGAAPRRPGAPPSLGGRFGQHYRIDRVLGVGGMGMVYAATDERLGRQVALKVVLGAYAQDADFVRRFEREAAILAQLDSPHVISIFDHGVEGGQGGTPFIVTQYAAGGDLGKVLAVRGALPPAVAVRVVAKLSDALTAAHEVGVVHRDVKPANVLLRDDRLDRIHVYLSDFGVALTETSGLTVPGSVAGTWNYLAPERTAGQHGSPSSDLYSLGCVLWEVLTGDPPYAGSDVEVAMEHLNSPVPQLSGDDDFTREANAVLARSMAKRPEDRYASATEMREALRSLGGGLGLTGSTAGGVGGAAGSTGAAGAAAHSGRRRTAVVAGLAAAALVVVGAGVGAAVLLDEDDTAPAAATPEPTPAIAGDVDRDGLGDLAWVDAGDDGYLRPGDGTTFAVDPQPLPGATDPSVLGDFDGDGANEVLTLPDDTGSTGASVRATFVTGPDAGTTSSVRLPRTSAVVDPAFLPADLDGDGADELVVATQNQAGTAVQTSVVGDSGVLAEREVVFDDDLPDSGFVPADVDGDGDDDLVALAQPEDLFGGDPGTVTVLLAEDGTLTAGEPVQYDTTTNYTSIATAMDVDGDGADELVTRGGDTVSVWQYEDDALARPEVWFTPPEDEPQDLSYPLPTDVDGDGTPELVLLPYALGEDLSINVLRVDGDAFTEDADARSEVEADTTLSPFDGLYAQLP